MKRTVIAIDGPAGAGKSTISKVIAQRLNLEFIDTGAMYRAITLKVIRNSIDINDEKQLLEMLDSTIIELIKGRILLDGIDVSEIIRMPEVTERVSEIAANALIRQKLVELQRQMAISTNVIMDGRDIGTNVLTNANYKIYLTASIEERAKRRYSELCSKGIDVKYDEIIKDIEQRDEKDSCRAVNPLRKAKDAILVDTTGKDIESVVEDILYIINSNRGE